MSMKIRLLAFATAAEVLGAGEQEMEVPSGTHVASLRTLLGERFPQLQPLLPRMAIALDGELVDAAATRLAEGCEVALLPPVSGG